MGLIWLAAALGAEETSPGPLWPEAPAAAPATDPAGETPAASPAAPADGALSLSDLFGSSTNATPPAIPAVDLPPATLPEPAAAPAAEPVAAPAAEPVAAPAPAPVAEPAAEPPEPEPPEPEPVPLEPPSEIEIEKLIETLRRMSGSRGWWVSEAVRDAPEMQPALLGVKLANAPLAAVAETPTRIYQVGQTVNLRLWAFNDWSREFQGGIWTRVSRGAERLHAWWTPVQLKPFAAERVADFNFKTAELPPGRYLLETSLLDERNVLIQQQRNPWFLEEPRGRRGRRPAAAPAATNAVAPPVILEPAPPETTAEPAEPPAPPQEPPAEPGTPTLVAPAEPADVPGEPALE